MQKDTSKPELVPGAVDSHAHVMDRHARLDRQRHPAAPPDATVEQYLGLLDAHGIRYGLLSAPSFYGTNNSMLLAALQSSNGRLRGTAVVEPDIGEHDLATLQSRGVCGLRLNWIRMHENRPDIGSPNYRSLLAKARNLGLHIELHLEGEYLSEVLPLVQESGANLVVDHFGHPGAQGKAVTDAGFETLLRALDRGDTWVKLSAPYRLRDCDAAKLTQQILLRDFGADRALWGTDWPWVGHEDPLTYQQCIDWLFEWVTNEQQRQRILVDTPHALFGFNQSAKEI